MEYYDLSDVKMPEGTTCFDQIVSNQKNEDYELSISLFDKCQLNCDFCFQSHNKDIDIDYIKSIPNKVLDIIPRLKKYGAKTLYIRLWGGELFHDGIPEEMFDLYSWLLDQLKIEFTNALPYLKIQYNFMSNGAWIKHRYKVLDLLKKHSAIMGFSYDSVGRFPTEKLRKLAIDNIRFYYENQGNVNVALTTTKRNIECILSGKDDFINNFPSKYSLEINYYIPGLDWKLNLPTDDMIFELFKYLLNKNMFNCKSLNSYITPVIYPDSHISSTCGCKCSDQFSNNCLVRDCIKRTSRLPSSDFYGELTPMLTENNAQEIKNYLGVLKRGCMYCENNHRCAWICFSSILFREYKITQCPISRLINYIDDNIEDIRYRYEEFNSKNDLDKIFESKFNPS